MSSKQRDRIFLLVVVIACYVLLPVTAALATDDGNQGDQSGDTQLSGDVGSGELVTGADVLPPADTGNDGSVDAATGDLGSPTGGDQGDQGGQGRSGWIG